MVLRAPAGRRLSVCLADKDEAGAVGVLAATAYWMIPWSEPPPSQRLVIPRITVRCAKPCTCLLEMPGLIFCKP